MKQDRLLTYKRFEKWLLGRSPRSRVGIANKPRDCPIARYLKEAHGWDAVLVSPFQFGHNDSGLTYKMPSWATSFIGGVDSLRKEWQRPVTQAQALKVLHWVKE